jgi:hypothetical protein
LSTAVASAVVLLSLLPDTASGDGLPVVVEVQQMTGDNGAGAGSFGFTVDLDACISLVETSSGGWEDTSRSVASYEWEAGSWGPGSVFPSDDRSWMLPFALSGDVVVAGSRPTRVFRRGVDGWELEAELPLLHPVNALAVDADAGLLVVGDTYNGAAHLYRENRRVWSLEGRLQAPSSIPGDGFGAAVAVDGATVVVGAPNVGGEDRDGAVFAFARSAAGWVSETVATLPGSFERRLGTSVAVDGDSLVVGAPGQDDRGAVHVLQRDQQGWALQATLTPQGFGSFVEFGQAVDIDGDAVVVGVPQDSSPYEGGSVEVFVREGEAWARAARLVPSSRPADLWDFGSSVAFSHSRAVVGSHGLQTGRAFFYDLSALVGPSPECPEVAGTGLENGYWMLSASGQLFAFGDAVDVVPDTMLAMLPGEIAVDLAGNPRGPGAWVLTSYGRVIAAGGAPHYGDPAGTYSTASVSGAFTTLAPHPAGAGYWVVTDLGEVLTFGGAGDHGSLVGVDLVGGVIDMAVTTTGLGYWLLGSDGGVFAFGDAEFHGSMGSRVLNEPAVGLVPDPDGVGYWFVAADGGVFAFDAPFLGSVPGVLPSHVSLAAPVNGMVPHGDGYLMVAADGGVFNFSSLDFLGSLGDVDVGSPVVGIAGLVGP